MKLSREDEDIYQNQENVCRGLALHIYAVNFDYFVAHVDQSRSVGSPSVHYPGDHNLSRLLVCLYCRSLGKREECKSSVGLVMGICRMNKMRESD